MRVKSAAEMRPTGPRIICSLGHIQAAQRCARIEYSAHHRSQPIRIVIAAELFTDLASIRNECLRKVRRRNYASPFIRSSPPLLDYRVVAVIIRVRRFKNFRLQMEWLTSRQCYLRLSNGTLGQFSDGSFFLRTSGKDYAAEASDDQF